jgi:hypothetical protein
MQRWLIVARRRWRGESDERGADEMPGGSSRRHHAALRSKGIAPPLPLSVKGEAMGFA